jgi:hypothetical protein
MPYPNQHAAPIADSAAFDQDSIRQKEIAPGVLTIMGKRKGSQTMEAISYRFDAAKFTAEQAKAWLKDKGIEVKGFEPATGEQAQGEPEEKPEEKPGGKPEEEPKEDNGKKKAPFAIENAGEGLSFEVSALAAGVFPGSNDGKPSDVPITDKQLDHAVSGTNVLIKAGKLNPPCKVGHGEDQRKLEAIFPDGGVPALGRIASLRRKGERVVFAIQGASEQFADYVRRGLWRPVSAELKRNHFDPIDGTHYPMIVTGMAWLGVSNPAVPIHEIFGLSEAQLAECGASEIITIDLESPRGDGQTDTGKERSTGDGPVTTPTEQEPTVNAEEEEMAEQEKVALADAEKERDAATAQLAEMRGKLFRTQLDGLVKDRRIKPGDVDNHLKLCNGMTDELADIHLADLKERPQYDDETEALGSTNTPATKPDEQKGEALLISLADADYEKHDGEKPYEVCLADAARKQPEADQAYAAQCKATREIRRGSTTVNEGGA